MATKNTTVEEVEETVEAELTEKQVINEGIARVIEATGIDVQKNRYKAMRAIAFQAFSNAIADGSFDDLVTEAIDNIDNLPSGWEIERTEKVEAPKPVKAAPKAAPAKAAPAKRAPRAAAAKAPAASARKRPTR
jgi:hypothetical protein